MNDSNDKEIKVTDKRLFTPDGELREEYRDLETSAPPEERPPAQSPPAAEKMSSEGSDGSVEAPFDPSLPGSAAGSGGSEQPTATVFDLIGVVAQPIALYLGDARMPDGESMENLEMARLYIDLLEVLKQKTEGNLSAPEATFLDDLLYQLRLRFVEKRKQGGGD